LYGGPGDDFRCWAGKATPKNRYTEQQQKITKIKIEKGEKEQ
jgi:hypothetical protein